MAYKLSDAINDAYERRWSMINTFTVHILFPEYVTDKLGINDIDETINLNIMSITTPDFNNTPIETFVANRWIIQNGRDELYRFPITFRDQNQMSLYKKFWTIYQKTKETYFDDIAMTIIIHKDGDWEGEGLKQFMRLEGALVESVSNLSFNNDTENQIAEFTVNFKCNKPVVL